MSLPHRSDPFVLDSAGSNTRARRILALRRPIIMFVPCFAHIFALICGDFTTLLSHAYTIANYMLFVSFLNNSSSLWLPLLREEMIRCNGDVVALILPVATRWTSTWISAVSVLQCKSAFSSVLTSQNGRERLSIAESSSSPRFAALKAVVDIIRSDCFWDNLSSHLDALVPTIESIFVTQGGSTTLADVLYCFGSQFQ
jgi:hypothetical protein